GLPAIRPRARSAYTPSQLPNTRSAAPSTGANRAKPDRGSSWLISTSPTAHRVTLFSPPIFPLAMQRLQTAVSIPNSLVIHALQLRQVQLSLRRGSRQCGPALDISRHLK